MLTILRLVNTIPIIGVTKALHRDFEFKYPFPSLTSAGLTLIFGTVLEVAP